MKIIGVMLIVIGCLFFSLSEVKANERGFVDSDIFTMSNDSKSEQVLLQSVEQKQLGSVRPWNLLSWGVRYANEAGVSMQTLVLVLLLPVLGSIVTFCRYVLGLPTLGMILPLALAAAFLSTGLLLGIGLLATILVASLSGKYILKNVRIMHYAKLSSSLLLVSLMVMGVITLGTKIFGGYYEQLTFLPVLVLVILSERLTALSLNRTLSAALYISSVNIGIALVGFLMMASIRVQQFVLGYPETILLLIPINILLGRYFGLRLTELFRFKKLLSSYERK